MDGKRKESKGQVYNTLAKFEKIKSQTQQLTNQGERAHSSKGGKGGKKDQNRLTEKIMYLINSHARLNKGKEGTNCQCQG